MDISLRANAHDSPIVDLPPASVRLFARRRPDVLKPLDKLWHVGLPWPLKRGTWDCWGRMFQNHATFREVEALLAVNLDYERLPSFSHAMRQIRARGEARSKNMRRNRQFRSEQAIHAHFRKVAALIRSIKHDGYDVCKGDAIGLGLGRRGQLIKLKHGHHRLAIAQLLDVPLVRFSIVAVHPIWLKNRLHSPPPAGFRSLLPDMVKQAL